MPPKPSINPSKKRKEPPTSSANVRASPNKRAKPSMANRRGIQVQPSITGLDAATGSLDVSAFVSAREFEIRALEQSMQRDRKGLSQRAFQQVPRNMRRRGASHNAKKVPKSLRKRAEREMKDDNTPTVNAKTRPRSRLTRIRMERAKKLVGINARLRADRAVKKKTTGKDGVLDPEGMVDLSRVPKVKKNVLSDLPKATSKFKKRQVHKAWLPTHLWHAKRAHMTRPTEPLWRMAIPLGPTEKSYRPTHRAGGGRGAVAWDMSYVSTIGCSGTESALDSVLKGLLFGEDVGYDIWGKKGVKWRNGTRAASGWVMDSYDEPRPVGPVTVIWCAASQSEVSADKDEVGEGQQQEDPTDRQLFIRAHPSTFLQLWTAILRIAKEQAPPVMVQDLRFEIGSIEITGPASTEALQGVIKSAVNSPAGSSWTKLAGLTNPASVPLGSVLAFDVLDPRLLHRPNSHINNSYQYVESEARLAELLVTWPPDELKTSSGLFSNKLRYAASKSLPSQKAVNRRRTLAPPGQAPSPKESDPRIPTILIALRPSAKSDSNAQGTWTLLLPWKCVDIIWRQLVYYPLSSGSTPRFAGLKQHQQLAFERQEAWFPGDLPGTEAGKAWGNTEDERRKKAWERKVPSRRVNWQTLNLHNGESGEVGVGWSCDWNFLFSKEDLKSADEKIEDKTLVEKPVSNDQSSASQAGPYEISKRETISYHQLTPQSATSMLSRLFNPTSNPPTAHSLATVRLTYLTRGTPLPTARIYRLPHDSNSRETWLTLATTPPLGGQGQISPNLKRDRTNHWGDIRRHHIHETENINDFHVPDYDPAWDESQNKAAKKSKSKSKSLPNPHGTSTSEPTTQSRASLAQSLLKPDKEEDTAHPPCPTKDNLIGFVTSGSYNLAEGMGTAIGSIWAEKVVEGWRSQIKSGSGDAEAKERQKRLVIVRNSGEEVGRLARWELV